MALLALEATPTRSFEAFGRSTVTLHFWHFLNSRLSYVLSCMARIESECTRRGTLFTDIRHATLRGHW